MNKQHVAKILTIVSAPVDRNTRSSPRLAVCVALAGVDEVEPCKRRNAFSIADPARLGVLGGAVVSGGVSSPPDKIYDNLCPDRRCDLLELDAVGGDEVSKVTRWDFTGIDLQTGVFIANIPSCNSRSSGHTLGTLQGVNQVYIC